MATQLDFALYAEAFGSIERELNRYCNQINKKLMQIVNFQFDQIESQVLQ